MLNPRVAQLPIALLLLSAQLGVLPQWSDATLSAARERIAVCSAGSKAFFAGGEAGTNLRSEVDIFDSRTGAWSLEHLFLPRTAAAATSVGGKVLIAGGTANTLA